MNKKFKEKIREAFAAVLPITVIVLLLGTILVPMDISTVIMFIVGALMLIVGMGFFQLGAEMVMTPMGEGIGAQIGKTKKLGLVILIGFAMGTIITIAEPDLTVLANQVASIPSMTLIITVAVGVGIFLAIALLRILLKISLSKLLIGCYLLVFIVSIFVPNEFVAVAFDSGGVTTGPITVPFILAIGVGLASIRSDKDASDDSFGLVALCSIGPILAVMMLGIFYNPTEATYSMPTVVSVATLRDAFAEFGHQLPHYAQEVLVALAPVALVFVIFQLITRRFKRRQLIRMVVGFVYTYVGLVLFLTGVNVGFFPVGWLLGHDLAAGPLRWLLIPLGMLIGYFIVAAEPAIHVLNHQVEEVTEGGIPHTAMNRALSIGVCVAVGLAMVRVLTGISVYWIVIPGYALALAMTFFVPKIFVGIAFDSGGVASGPMTATFLLPLAMGACEGVGGNIMTDAFGVVAMVALTPLIAIQVMGLVYKIKASKGLAAPTAEAEAAQFGSDDEIVEYDEVESYE